jgi:hypothetical protein
MDPFMQWYQQGPYPIDLIAEKLVIKKALKHARQQSLKYNYLTVHPSWVASRARKRRETQLVPLGLHVHFTEDGQPEQKIQPPSLQWRVGETLDSLGRPILNSEERRHIANANLSTTFISSDLVRGQNLVADTREDPQPVSSPQSAAEALSKTRGSRLAKKCVKRKRASPV